MCLSFNALSAFQSAGYTAVLITSAGIIARIVKDFNLYCSRFQAFFCNRFYNKGMGVGSVL